MYKIGDLLIINHMDGVPNYCGKEGIITSIGDMGQIRGTWGSISVIPSEDDFSIIPKEELN